MERRVKEEVLCDEPSASSVERVEVNTEEKSFKEERISDEEEVLTSEDKVFLAGTVEVEYSLDNYENKSSTDFGRTTLKQEPTDFEPVFSIKKEKEVDDDSGKQPLFDGSTPSGSTSVHISKLDHSDEEGENNTTAKEDQSDLLRCSIIEEIHGIPAVPAERVTTVHLTDKNVCLEGLQMTLTEEKLYQCDLCKKQFFDSDILKKHLKIHTEGKRLQCNQCGQKFSRNFGLKTHLRMHAEERPFECDICQKIFSHNSYLDEHKKRHAAEKLFQCDTCEKRFSLSSGLKKHLRTHSEERPFRCDVCEKHFLNRYDLKQHDMIHRGEKPFQCDLCEQRFLRRYDLKTHRRMHTGERPFQCDVCLKQFAQRSNLTAHKGIHKREKPSPS